jgi:hypothetical protein
VHFVDYRSAKALVELQIREGERRAAYGRIWEVAVLAQPGLLSRQVRRFVGHMGQLMIRLGCWLKRYDLPEPLALREEMRGGG